MRRSTLALIGAAARADTSAVAALLADDFAFYPPGGGPGLGRDRITSLVRTELGGAFKVDDWTAVELQASSDHRRPTDPERGQTQIHVRATIDGFLTFSWWKFDWERAPDGQWKLISAEPSDPSAGTWMGQRFGR